MSKTNRMYKIFMTVMVTIIAGLLLACGVIAVKNSMRVKMSIPANPNFLIEIYIQKDGSETQNLVFKNFDEVQIQNGISGLNANTLVASDDFITRYGGDFSIIIKNFTENMPMLVTVTSTATLANGNDGVPAEITAEKSAAVAYDKATADEVKFNVANKAVFPQTTLIEIKFEQIDGYVVSFNANGGSGTMPAQQHALDGSTALTECTFTAPAGKEFAGWATSANGSVEYTDGESVSNLKTKAGEEIMLYAVWQEPGYTITFSLDNLKAEVGTTDVTSGYTVEQNGGVTIKLSPSTQANLETHSASVPTIPVNSCTSYTYDVTTGTLQLNGVKANMQITAEELPWTYGTYVDSGASTIGTQVSYNTVYYPAFNGYKYIQFANHATQEANYYKSAAGDIGARWIIIGAGSSVSNATMLGAVQNTYVTSYAFKGTLTNAKYSNTGKNSELGESQVLLLSEQTLKTNVFNSSTSDGSEWKTSAIRNFLNGDFLTNSGLNTYINSSPSYIVQPNTNLNTAYKSTSGSVTSSTDTTTNSKSSYIFLLGSRYGYLGTSGAKASVKADMGTESSVAPATKKTYYGQNFVVEDYLGTDDATITLDEVTYSGGDYTRGTSTAPKLASFTGATSSYWWLRSGYCDAASYAYLVDCDGYVNDIFVNISDFGVRPSFILNLA